MNRNAHRSHRSIRTLLVTITMLIVSTIFVAGNASADVLVPREDTGGSGGGGGAAELIDEAYAAAAVRWATIGPSEQGMVVLGRARSQARQINSEALSAF
jgi:hypothetical protein